MDQWKLVKEEPPPLDVHLWLFYELDGVVDRGYLTQRKSGDFVWKTERGLFEGCPPEPTYWQIYAGNPQNSTKTTYFTGETKCTKKQWKF